ncbi:MAG: reductive dehalogenase [Chloroflexi bacterium]|nr:reductive dehalogenase [Chloroflexota bacterium]
MGAEKVYSKIMTGNGKLGPYPMEKLKRVDKPTTLITDAVQRTKAADAQETGANQADRPGLPSQAVVGRVARPPYPITAAETDVMRLVTRAFDGEVAGTKAPIPQDPGILSRHIKRLGYFLRADMVAICRLPQWAVYGQDRNGNPVELNHQFAIVLAVDQEYETMDASTGHDWITGAQSFRGYSNTTFIASMMANYIRRLGYPARAHHNGSYQVVVPPLLLLSGIGEISRMGIIVNPFLGARFKAAVVTTDLPLEPDKPIDFGLQEFCRNCLKCARECRSRAIPTGDKIMHNGYETWKLDVERCRKFRAMNSHGSGCGHCIKVCPWNKPSGAVHNVVRWTATQASKLHAGWVHKLIVKGDDLFGYGKPHPEKQWWFDLTDTHSIPIVNIDEEFADIAQVTSGKGR